MAISFDKAFGISQYAVQVRQERAELLASNLANADTPGYKAKDLDFKAALAEAQSGQQGGQSLVRTNDRHLAASLGLDPAVGYRNPNQPDTGDGNTVDVQVERSLFMQNAMEYQTSLQFLSGRIKGLMSAIKGE
ncbi:flagellar basal body rod protein FlgB [Gallaecimonas kandeliae]|uniref:flagellar basal body rod protein FlgB n=1 Tax=Gallaecimonas kandeliae TaxID=3029055 RepID=UPI0026487E38|nr:flagellar basal body rod protein FlgB [Gallaecimonas kandeliae]WKE66707.1 flagellar basal body rod protein FlgB [Gallaecimonas kandeliae]